MGLCPSGVSSSGVMSSGVMSEWGFVLDSACQDTTLAGNSLMVAVLSKTSKILLSHAMTQNCQVSQISKTQFACSFYTTNSENINSILCYVRPREFVS